MLHVSELSKEYPTPRGPLRVLSDVSFDLKPGEIRWLVFKGTYDCGTMAPDGGELGLVDFPVRSKFLWRTRTVFIPLDEPLTFRLARTASCPARP